MGEDIFEIISKSISEKRLDNNELEKLDKWLNSDKINLQLYNQIKHLRINTKSTNESFFNIDLAWEKYNNLYRRKQKQQRKILLNHILRYAAIFIGIFLLSGVFYYLMRDQKVMSPETEIFTEIIPGSSKAELLLDDGKVIALNNQKTNIINNTDIKIDNTGNTLVYKSENRAISKTEYHTLRIPRGGEFKLTLHDGTHVWLNSETQLKYPISFSGNERIVYLEGEAFFDVKKSKIPFIVKMNEIDLNVLGTSFNVYSYENENNIFTTLVEGSIEIYDNTQKSNKIMLVPGYQANFSKKEKSLRSEKVNVEVFTAWKDGKFVFDKHTLEQIMDKVSRWYDVEVSFTNEKLKGIRFSGGIKRYENMEVLLQKMAKTNDFTFKINGKSIIIKNS